MQKRKKKRERGARSTGGVRHQQGGQRKRERVNTFGVAKGEKDAEKRTRGWKKALGGEKEKMEPVRATSMEGKFAVKRKAHTPPKGKGTETTSSWA